MQHHQKFDYAYGAFKMIRNELQKYFEKSSEFKDTGILIHWLRNKAEEDLQLTDKNSETLKMLVSSIDTLEKLSQQVMFGGDSSHYNCDEYEVHMRAVRRIAEYIGAETTKEQFDWFFLLPFDFPFFDLLGESQLAGKNLQDIRQVKVGWDQTLLKWAHAKGNEYFGQYKKEDAEEGFFVPEKYHHRCHSNNDK